MSESPKSRTSKHSKKSYKSDQSDVEYSDSQESYKRHIKKLSKDKSLLKDKLRRLLDEVDARNDEHNLELEKTQNYFQEQISELSEERDRALDEVEKIRASVLEQREKLRRDFDERLLKHKQTLENRYMSGTTSATKRLENTILTLQNKLNEMAEERDNIKMTAEQYFGKREEQLRHSIADLEEQLRKSRELQAEDRKQVVSLNNLFAHEKEQLRIAFQKEKDAEIQKIIIDKNNVINNLQNIREEMEKRLQAVIKEKHECDKNANQRIKEERLAEEKAVEMLKGEFLNQIEEQKNYYEGRVFDAKKQYEHALQEQLNKFNKDAEILQYNVRKEYEVRMDETNSELQRNKEEITRLINENKALLDHTEKRIEFAVQEENKKSSDMIQKIKNSCEEALKVKEQEINNLKLQQQKRTGEQEEIVQELKKKIANAEVNFKKLQEQTNISTSKLSMTSQQEKEKLENELTSKNQQIEELTRQFRRLSDETIDKCNSLDRKLKLSTSELTEVTEKYSKVRQELKEQEQLVSIQKQEISKHKSEVDRLNKQHYNEVENLKVLNEKLSKQNTELNTKVLDLTNELQIERSKLGEAKKIFIGNEQKINSLENTVKEKQTANEKLMKDLYNKQEEVSLARALLENMKQKLSIEIHNEYMQRLSSLEKEVMAEREKASKFGAEYQNIKKKFDFLSVQSVKLANERKEFDEKIGKVEELKQENAHLQKTVSNLNGLLRDLKNNSETAINKLTKDFTEKISCLQGEIKIKSDEISSVRKQFDQSQSQSSNIINSNNIAFEKEKQKYKDEINRLMQENANTRNMNDKITKEIIGKESMVSNLKEQIDVLQKESRALKDRAENASKELYNSHRIWEEKEKKYTALTSSLNEKIANLSTQLNVQAKNKDSYKNSEKEKQTANEKLFIAEQTIKKLENDLHSLHASNEQIKKSFVEQLNKQQEDLIVKEKELLERIAEKEKVLNNREAIIAEKESLIEDKGTTVNEQLEKYKEHIQEKERLLLKMEENQQKALVDKDEIINKLREKIKEQDRERRSLLLAKNI